VAAPALALGPGHRVSVAYYDLQDDAVDYQGLEGPKWEGNWSAMISVSTDGGNHFSTGSVVDDQVVPAERVMLIFTMPPPALALDRKGRTFVAWDDARNGDRDVFLRRSTNNGRSFGPLQRLNDDPVKDGRDQYLPRLAVASGGRVDAVFYDRRDDTANVRADLLYTFSGDAGGSFSPNLKLNSESFDTRTGARYPIPSAAGLVDFGSRLGLLSKPSGAVAAWSDTRNVPPGLEHQDIFSAEVVFPRKSK